MVLKRTVSNGIYIQTVRNHNQSELSLQTLTIFVALSCPRHFEWVGRWGEAYSITLVRTKNGFRAIYSEHWIHFSYTGIKS